MTDTAWTCERHDTTQPDGKTFCQPCMEAFEARKYVAEMTVEERIAELQALENQLTIPFDNLHQRITELMGRPVWTHELADPEQLYEEIREGRAVGINEVIAKLPQDKVIVIVGQDKGAPS